MDQGPDGKRPRLASWSASSQGTSLPHPHSTQLGPPHPHSHPHPHHHHQPAPGGYQQYPRPADISAPPTPVSVRGHAQHRPDVDSRDQESLAPMQDHYRQPPPPPPPPQQQQPPSPAGHGPYQPYPRDPIKREVPDDSRRPNSTGHAPDSMQPSPHPGSTSHPPPPHPSTAYADNQPRHMSYDAAPTPGGYRAPSYPPPTPLPHQSSYEYGSYSSGGEPFQSVYSTIPAKKKNTRASQACDQCRQLKAKCDETKPCKTCRDKGTECRYRDPVPKATDKAQADILEGITVMQNTLNRLTDHVVDINERLIKIESHAPRQVGSAPIKSDPNISHEEYINEAASKREYYQREQDIAAVPHSSSFRVPADDVDADVEVEPGPPVAPGEPAIPINHTTLAGLLLEWPSIREMTKHHLEREKVKYVSEFPISQETSRGHLIVYGRGEDTHPSRAQREVILPDQGAVEMADDSSDMASPSPAAADYGLLGGLSPGEPVEYRGGVLAVDGNPDFSDAKVWLYVQSFKDNILNMHPIIQPKTLEYWVQHFLETLPVQQQKTVKGQSIPLFAVSGAQTPTEATGAKRKRSPDLDGPDAPPPTSAPIRSGRPKRSIHNALVLCVLALGKISLYKDKIPDVVQPSDSVSHGSPVTRNGVPPSPAQGSPPGFSSQSQSSGLPSPKEQERGHQSRRSSIHGPSPSRPGYSLKKNYEVIPGLEYFAFATDILGNHTGAYNNMATVYANILAGLYHGQLGRPLESFAYIHQASHKLQVLMRPSLDKMRKLKQTATFIQEGRYNQLALAFWTCLQLESDLIAELPLPPSGLLSYEDDMPHPNMSLLHDYDQRILDSYPGQLYLRTHLNSIHRMFYAPDIGADKKSYSGKDTYDEKFKNVDLVVDAVSSMGWVAPSMVFSEDDEPANDILAARLRAKYWGAQTLTYRPFIRQILQFSHSMKNHPSSPNLPGTTEFRQGIVAPVIHPNTRNPSEIDPQIIELASKGIRALIESTRAFHNLPEGRPIITNVFGTAHAQWGNLLVLSAAFRDPLLKRFVDEGLLRTLFHRTIAFLRQSATTTSSLKIDMHILEGLQRDLFYSSDVRTNSSVSSSGTMQTPTMSVSAPPPHPPYPPHMHEEANLGPPKPHHNHVVYSQGP